MNLKKTVARELAYALLSGPPEKPGAVLRCARVLGGKPAWLHRMVDVLTGKFAHDWDARSIEAITSAICEYPAYQGASRPRLFQPALDGLSMAPRPWPLGDCAVPALHSIHDLAQWLDEPIDQLPWLAQFGYRASSEVSQALSHYVYRWLEKRNGGFRLLESPKPRLKVIQRRILHGLLEYLPPHEAAQGFRRGHSCLSNASMHVDQEVVIRFDLSDFFLHIRKARVERLLRTVGYPGVVSELLAGLCTNSVPATIISEKVDGKPCLGWEQGKRHRSPHLPQGAPTSPALANLCAFRLDLRLQGLAERWSGSYSRYADDMTLSGGPEMARVAERLIPLVGAIAAEEGFELNFRKTRIMRRSGRQVVTGVVVNKRPNIKRQDYDVLKATLFNCVRFGPHGQNTYGYADYKAHLLGRIAQVRYIHPERGGRLMELYQRIKWD